MKKHPLKCNKPRCTNDGQWISVYPIDFYYELTDEFIAKHKKYFIQCDEKRVVIRHCDKHSFELFCEKPGWITKKENYDVGH